MHATRFCPTASSGPLHLGHLINVFGALLHALKHQAKFFVKAEYKATLDDPSVEVPEDHSYEGERWLHFTRNLKTIRRLLPGVPVVTTVETADLLRYRYGQNANVAAALDATLDVDCIVRGQEWNPQHAADLVAPADAKAMLVASEAHRGALEAMIGRPIELWFTPILLDASGRKISKRDVPFELTVEAAETAGYAPRHLFAYAGCCLGWRPSQTFDDFVANFHLSSVRETVTVPHDSDRLQWCRRLDPFTEDAYRALVSRVRR